MASSELGEPRIFIEVVRLNDEGYGVSVRKEISLDTWMRGGRANDLVVSEINAALAESGVYAQ